MTLPNSPQSESNLDLPEIPILNDDQLRQHDSADNYLKILNTDETKTLKQRADYSRRYLSHQMNRINKAIGVLSDDTDFQFTRNDFDLSDELLAKKVVSVQSKLCKFEVAQIDGFFGTQTLRRLEFMANTKKTRKKLVDLQTEIVDEQEKNYRITLIRTLLETNKNSQLGVKLSERLDIDWNKLQNDPEYAYKVYEKLKVEFGIQSYDDLLSLAWDLPRIYEQFSDKTNIRDFFKTLYNLQVFNPNVVKNSEQPINDFFIYIQTITYLQKNLNLEVTGVITDDLKNQIQTIANSLPSINNDTKITDAQDADLLLVANGSSNPNLTRFKLALINLNRNSSSTNN